MWNFIFFALICACAQSSVLPANAQWQKKEADIYFLLDSSSSVWIVDYNKQLKFVADLVADMDIGPSTTRVGVGIFSEFLEERIPLDNPFTSEQLQQQIVLIPKNVGNTYISRALKGLREQGLAPRVVRSDVPLIAVLITDGMSRHKQLTQDNATLAKNSGIFIFTIGVGNGVDKEELRIIASDPKTDFSFHVPDFEHLNDIRADVSLKMSEVEVLQQDKGSCGEHTVVDTVFVFDESAIGTQDSRKIRTFIKSVTQDFSMNSGNMRVGVVSKTCHEGDIMLEQYVTKEDFAAGIEDGNGPEITSLVERVQQTAFTPDNGARLNAKRRIVLILHAPVEKSDDLRREIYRAIYINRMEVFVIRLGTDYDKGYINSLASNPDRAFFPGTIDQLPDIKDRFLNVFCEEL